MIIYTLIVAYTNTYLSTLTYRLFYFKVLSYHGEESLSLVLWFRRLRFVLFCMVVDMRTPSLFHFYWWLRWVLCISCAMVLTRWVGYAYISNLYVLHVWKLVINYHLLFFILYNILLLFYLEFLATDLWICLSSQIMSSVCAEIMTFPLFTFRCFIESWNCLAADRSSVLSLSFPHLYPRL